MRTALITGAASGIGRAFAVTLARSGHRLVLLDLDARGLDTARDAAAALGVEVSTAAVDIAERSQVDRAVADLAGPAGGLDLVVNCAAVLGPGTWSEQEANAFDRVVRVDLLGTANVVRAALPLLEKAHGTVVSVASTAAVHGWPGLAAYSAAKCGITGWSDAIRPELRRRGVHVVVVYPLLIDTPLLDRPDLPPILKKGRRIPSQVVVDRTLAAVARRRRRVYVPGTVRLIALLHGIWPSLLDSYGARFGLPRIRG